VPTFVERRADCPPKLRATMTTAELGLITTAIVGVAAAASPALVSWANRKHDRAMTRSARLYEQRRNAYQDLAVFLERARTGLERTARKWSAPPTAKTADEWIDLMARAAVVGSAEVQAKLADFHEEEFNFHIASGDLRSAVERQDEEQIREMHELVEGFRSGALALIDEAEQTMREELAGL
jgi:hypothetical protein